MRGQSIEVPVPACTAKAFIQQPAPNYGLFLDVYTLES